MSNFLKAKKYYTRREIDEYVKKLMTNTEVTLMEQRERILDLKQENERLLSELSSKKKTEKGEKKAIDKASQYASKLEEDVKVKCAKELMRVKEFALNWYNKFDKLVEKYDIVETDLADRLIIETDAISKQYSSLTSSENKDLDKRFNDLLARVKDKRKKEVSQAVEFSNSVFSIEEALNPVDPLEDILSDLLGDV